MGLRETVRKAAGLIFELPPEGHSGTATPSMGTTSSSELEELLSDLEGKKPPVRTAEQIVQESPGPNLDQITTAPLREAVPASADGELDFAAIYRSAAIAPAGFSAEQMLEMLGSLPAELPLETKRQTVRVTLGSLGKTVGATPETIVADASRKLAALHAYVEAYTQKTGESVAAAEREIASLQAQIEERKKAIQDSKLQMTRVSQGCDAESDRLDDVLEFFSLDVHPSKYADGTPAA